MTSSRYPMPTPARRRITQELAEQARVLDAEADARRPRVGTWNDIVTLELRRAAGTIRLVATLVVNGSMSTRRARFWVHAGRDYLKLVRRADIRGVIR